MSRVDKFRKRKALLNELHSKPDVRLAKPNLELAAFLESDIDHELINSQREQSDSFFSNQYDLHVSQSEIRSYLDILDRDFTSQRYDVLFDSTKEVVVDQLLRPLGLSRRDLAANDKEGGPVTTLNNFKDGVTATTEDEASYKEWQKSINDFDDKPYRGNDFKKIRKSKLQEGGPLIDGYSNKEIPKDGRSHLEHITSAHEIETDPKSHLGMNLKERVDMASADENLTMIDASMNQSKGEKDLQEWRHSQNSKDKSKTNGEYYEVDDDSANQQYAKSKGHVNKTTSKEYHGKLVRETLETSVSAAKNVGLQQAIGSLFSDLISAIFGEVKDIFANGFKTSPDHGFWVSLKERLQRVAKSIVGNWESVLRALQNGIMGAINAFVSNICTVVINTLVKTSKNMVRIIRESFLSLMKALKVMLSPSQGVSFKEGAHEASKVLASGVVVSLGIFADEAISTYLSGFAIPFSDVISGVISGLVTGLGSLLVVYMLDKLDLFGVNQSQRIDFIQGRINEDFEKDYQSAEDIINRMGVVTI